MPPNTIYVGRPTRWGNPYVVGVNASAKGCVTIYRENWERHIADEPAALDRLRAALGGKDLACWCSLDQPCHVDVLLELANGPLVPNGNQ